jgi:ubiquinone/menaquinone biosynthesis C-methylase UbiE
MSTEADHLAPLSDDHLRLALRGLGLPAQDARVADLCCGLGSASRLLAREFGAVCTGVDMSDVLLRAARERALAENLSERVEFVHGDARHVILPSGSFDLVLALGGALTYMGRGEGLERIRLLLKPGGRLLISDLVYLDSPVPEEIARRLAEEIPGDPVAPFPLGPAVRAVFEEGVYLFETEEAYRVLLRLHGFDPAFTFNVPESAWNGYYRRAVLSTEADSPTAIRVPVGTDELAAFYCWGGRWGLAYMVAGATLSGATLSGAEAGEDGIV